jgi:hypothetical protein
VLEANKGAPCAANYTLVASALIVAGDAGRARALVGVFLEIYADLLDQCTGSVGVLLKALCDMCTGSPSSPSATAARAFLTEFLLGYCQSDPRVAIEHLVKARAADAVACVLLGLHGLHGLPSVGAAPSLNGLHGLPSVGAAPSLNGPSPRDQADQPDRQADSLVTYALCVALKEGDRAVISAVMPIAAREEAGRAERAGRAGRAERAGYMNGAVARAVSDYVARGYDLGWLFGLMDESFGAQMGLPGQVCRVYELCAPAVRCANWGAVKELLARGLVMPSCVMHGGKGEQEIAARAEAIVGNMACLFSASRPPTGDTLEVVLEVLGACHGAVAGLQRTQVLERLHVPRGLLAGDEGTSKASVERMVSKYGYSAHDLAMASGFLERAVQLRYYELVSLLISRLAEEGKLCDALCRQGSVSLLQHAPDPVLDAMFAAAAPEAEKLRGEALTVLASLRETHRLMSACKYSGGSVSSTSNKASLEAMMRQEERAVHFYANPWVVVIQAAAKHLGKDRLWFVLARSTGGDDALMMKTLERVYDTRDDALLVTAVRDTRILEALVRSSDFSSEGSLAPTRAALLGVWVRLMGVVHPERELPGSKPAEGGVFVDRGLIKASLEGDARASKELKDQLEALAAFMVAERGRLGAFCASDLVGTFGMTIRDAVGGEETETETEPEPGVAVTRRIRDSGCGRGMELECLGTLVRACMATGGFDRRHPTGAIPTSAASTEVMQLLGFAIGRLVLRGATTGPCISTALLARVLGCEIPTVAEALLGTVSPVGSDLCTALSLFGGLTEGFAESDVESVRSAMGGGTEITIENRALFFGAVERIAMGWDQLGRPMKHITAGFLDSVSETRVLGDELMAPLALLLSGPCATRDLVIGAVSIDAGELAALRSLVEYESGLSEEHRTVRWLWSIVGKMSQETLVLFLRFWTSQNPPPGGFRGLRGERYIVSAAMTGGGAGGSRGTGGPMILPTASTCFNTLYVSSEYGSEEQMERALYYAIQNTDTGMHEGWGGIVAQ